MKMTRKPTRREREASEQRRTARQRKTRLIWAAGIVAVAAVAVLIVAGGLLRDDGKVQTVSAAQRDGRVLGEKSAPVIITAWEDFQCPVCKAANSSTLATIIQEYVDTGKVQLQYRYYSFLGDESVRAAEAAEAAAAQGKFWEYHDALYTYQGAENSGAFSDDRLTQLAQLVGLDLTQFEASLDSGEYEGVVEDELAEGQMLGVMSTPTFFVNGAQVEDWRDVDAFRALIDSLLPAGS
jgi:protein-disulfide isomerase